ncbi:MAG: regulatory protein RecX, partial [Thermomicrobiales bacterium]
VRRVGGELDAERVDALRALDETSKATDAAIGLLAHRPRSVQEIRRRLLLKGFGAATIDGALDRLERWRYVDDEAFARFWVENREANKPRGRRLIEQELRTKGLDREIIAQAISEAEIDEHAAALGLARGRLHSYSGMDQAMARRRLGAWLARRGYGYDVVKPVLAAVFTGADDDAEDGDEEPG